MISTARAALDGERLLGRPVHRPGHDAERERGAEGVERTGATPASCRGPARRRAGSRHPEGEGGAHQQQQDQRQDERERERQPVADDLGQLLAGLGQRCAARRPSAPARPPARARGPARRRDEDVLQREARLAGTRCTRMPWPLELACDVHASPSRPSSSTMTCSRSPNSDTRHALPPGLEQVRRALRLVDGESPAGGRPARLLMPLGVPSATSSPATMKPRRLHCSAFLQVVRGDQDRRAGVGELVDHAARRRGARSDRRRRSARRGRARAARA